MDTSRLGMAWILKTKPNPTASAISPKCPSCSPAFILRYVHFPLATTPRSCPNLGSHTRVVGHGPDQRGPKCWKVGSPDLLSIPRALMGHDLPSPSYSGTGIAPSTNVSQLEAWRPMIGMTHISLWDTGTTSPSR